MSKSNSGEHSGNYKKYGYKNPTSKPVFQFDLNGNYIKDYGGAKDAARINNYKTASNICCCCNKYQNVTKAHGYIWRWQKDFTDQEKYDLIHNIKNLFDIENSRNM